MNSFNVRKLALVLTMLGSMGFGFAQISPNQYDDCSPEALLFALRNLEDQIAVASATPVVRTDYSINAADAGVSDKVYMLYRCEVLQDSIVALEARLDALLGGTPPPPPTSSFTCGTSTVTYDGHNYTTVQIGTQCWFKENLRNDNYNDGSSIPGGLDNATWSSTTSGAFTIYDEGGANEASNLVAYGRLYNWYAVNTGKMCPSGWHVPTDAEWMTLETHLGGESVAGDAMKSVSPVWNGSNSSGFSGLPAGYRTPVGSFGLLGTNDNWWSSSTNGGDARYRYIYSNDSDLYRDDNGYTSYGLSIRCVQD